ncbi:MAG: universal stress protein, partial [Bacteroidota bacterium]
MKIIIISDIKGESESVIPYGLNLAKNLEAEVEIIHVIDSRTLQGVQSPYSDSQSVSPGNKLSHKEIIEREKKFAEIELDKLLSSEASRLNYPLKIKTHIVEGNNEKIISQRIKSAKQSILIMSSVPDNLVFSSRKEILDIIYRLDTLSLLVSPGYKYKEFKKVALLSIPKLKKINTIKERLKFLEHFNPGIHIVNFVKNKNKVKRKIKNGTLERTLKEEFKPFDAQLNTIYQKKQKPCLDG